MFSSSRRLEEESFTRDQKHPGKMIAQDFFVLDVAMGQNLKKCLIWGNSFIVISKSTSEMFEVLTRQLQIFFCGSLTHSHWANSLQTTCCSDLCNDWVTACRCLPFTQQVAQLFSIQTAFILFTRAKNVRKKGLRPASRQITMWWGLWSEGLLPAVLVLLDLWSEESLFLRWMDKDFDGRSEHF